KHGWLLMKWERNRQLVDQYSSSAVTSNSFQSQAWESPCQANSGNSLATMVFGVTSNRLVAGKRSTLAKRAGNRLKPFGDFGTMQAQQGHGIRYCGKRCSDDHTRRGHIDQRRTQAGPTCAAA